jgi:hypothetical protein
VPADASGRPPAEYHDGVRNTRWTFAAPEVRAFVERHLVGKTLNLFAGKTRLVHPDGDEIRRNDANDDRDADSHRDALDLADDLAAESFGTVILDPPFTVRKGNEKYDGETVGHWKTLFDRIVPVIEPGGHVLTFGRSTTGLGRGRGFEKVAVGVFCHGGDINDTLAVVERRPNQSLGEFTRDGGENGGGSV